jgi:hypothetical protein
VERHQGEEKEDLETPVALTTFRSGEQAGPNESHRHHPQQNAAQESKTRSLLTLPQEQVFTPEDEENLDECSRPCGNVSHRKRRPLKVVDSNLNAPHGIRRRPKNMHADNTGQMFSEEILEVSSIAIFCRTSRNNRA